MFWVGALPKRKGESLVIKLDHRVLVDRSVEYRHIVLILELIWYFVDIFPYFFGCQVLELISPPVGTPHPGDVAGCRRLW